MFVLSVSLVVSLFCLSVCLCVLSVNAAGSTCSCAAAMVQCRTCMLAERYFGHGALGRLRSMLPNVSSDMVERMCSLNLAIRKRCVGHQASALVLPHCDGNMDNAGLCSCRVSVCQLVPSLCQLGFLCALRCGESVSLSIKSCSTRRPICGTSCGCCSCTPSCHRTRLLFAVFACSLLTCVGSICLSVFGLSVCL